MLSAALDLASSGWAVLPCFTSGPKAKAPLTPNGFKDASSDPVIIRRWWERYPVALIGIAIPEHLIVLDIDPRNGGSLEVLEDVLGPLPKTLTSWSGRNDGGRHLWFLRPSGSLSGRKLPAGVDLKLGGRGYCIAPPSIHPATGQPYRWQDAQIVELPAGAHAVLRTVPQASPVRPPIGLPGGRGAGLIRFVAESVEGERNSRTFWAACRALECGHDDLMQDLFDAALSVGLSDREAAQAIASARRTIGGAA